MKAVRIHEHGGPENLRIDDIPIPEPGNGEIRLRVEYAGLNFIDVYQRKGLYKIDLPGTLGMEAAGTVDAVGRDVGEWKPGDRAAFAMCRGAWAEYVTVPSWKAVPVPDGINPRIAAAAVLQGMTAQFLTGDTYPLNPGDTALIQAAAGGVGLLLVQAAKIRGAKVIGTCSTEEKAAMAREAGADEVIIYTEEDFLSRTRELTGGRGVDVVYDSVGNSTFMKSLDCLRPRGYMVLFGQSSGPVPPIDPQLLNSKGSLFLTRPSIVHHMADSAEIRRRANDLFDWILTGKLNVRIDREYGFSEASDAQKYLEDRSTKGKVILAP